MTMIEEALAAMPVPDRLSFGGFAPGEVPYVMLVYELGKHDEALERLLGAVFGQAKAASTDGTVKVEIK
jgi:hypothetical protein